MPSGVGQRESEGASRLFRHARQKQGVRRCFHRYAHDVTIRVLDGGEEVLVAGCTGLCGEPRGVHGNDVGAEAIRAKERLGGNQQRCRPVVDPDLHRHSMPSIVSMNSHAGWAYLDVPGGLMIVFLMAAAPAAIAAIGSYLRTSRGRSRMNTTPNEPQLGRLRA